MLIPEFFQFSKLSLKTPQIPENNWISGEVETLSWIVTVRALQADHHAIQIHKAVPQYIFNDTCNKN